MQDFNQFVIDAMREEGVSDTEISAALGKISGNEKLSKRLGTIVKTATEDYTAQVGRAQAAQAEADKWKTWGAQAVPAHNTLQSEYQKVKTELDRLQAGGFPAGFDPSNYLTKADLAAQADQMAIRLSSVVKDTSAISTRHALAFKEPLDFDAVDAIASERGLPISAAYEAYIAPRKAENDKADRAKWEADKTAEIERDLRTRLNVPPDAAAPAVSNIFQRPPADALPKDMMGDLLATWNNAANGKNAA